MFKKIMVPLDGSDHSTRALQEALKIAKMVDGAITLIHVYSIGTSFVVTAKQDYFYQLALKNGENILSDGKNRVKGKGVKVKTQLLEGNAVEQIVKAAKEGDFNLIVISARGLSQIKEILLGSVSDGVIRKAPCPVLVISARYLALLNHLKTN